MNILIFENNDDDFNHLTSCIKNYFTKENINYHIHRCKNKEELLKTIQQYNLLFLDIELDEDNGIDLGMELKKSNHDCRIMITTNYAKYAIDGYKINADRYFIKPINQQEFNIEIDFVINKYNKDNIYFFDKNICNYKIYVKDIIYIEFINRKSVIHQINGKKIDTNCTLKYWYEKLNSLAFAYSYKAFLVNLEYVVALYKNDLKMINDDIVPLSRHYKKEFETKYLDFLQDTL